MFSPILFKQGMKESWRLLFIFGAVLAMYFIIIIYMFDPKLSHVFDEYAKAMPQMMSMFGMKSTSGSLIEFLASYLYGFIIPVLPMVFAILCANRLIARHVDRGSMSYLLSAPVKRVSVAVTQAMVLVTGIVLLVAFSTVLGIVTSEFLFKGDLDKEGFIMINIGALSMLLFIAGICFICSCIFSDAKKAAALGAGIPSLMYIIQMLANAGEKFEDLKYATFFTLFDPDGIIKEDTFAYVQIVILFAGALLLFAAAVIVFRKKDLHI
jgi:ABC-2 type transport system permease protein